jgi:hypothetical protein
MLTSRWKLLVWIYLTALLLESIFAGWLLSDYHVPWFTWVGTQAVTLHIAWVGTDAVALAVAWIIGLVWAGAIAYAWPGVVQGLGVAIWIYGVGMPLWAGALAFGWVLGVVLALTLAFAKRATESVDWSKAQAFLILVLITWLGFGIGRIVNSGFFPGSTH